MSSIEINNHHLHYAKSENESDGLNDENEVNLTSASASLTSASASTASNSHSESSSLNESLGGTRDREHRQLRFVECEEGEIVDRMQAISKSSSRMLELNDENIKDELIEQEENENEEDDDEEQNELNEDELDDENDEDDEYDEETAMENSSMTLINNLYQQNCLAAAQMMQLMCSSTSTSTPSAVLSCSSSSSSSSLSPTSMTANAAISGVSAVESQAQAACLANGGVALSENEKENIPICKYCNKVFANFSNLNHHISAIHLNQSKWVCSQCGKV
jgi:uncharacterized protein YcbK (DUF882 family)